MVVDLVVELSHRVGISTVGRASHRAGISNISRAHYLASSGASNQAGSRARS